MTQRLQKKVRTILWFYATIPYTGIDAVQGGKSIWSANKLDLYHDGEWALTGGDGRKRYCRAASEFGIVHVWMAARESLFARVRHNRCDRAQW